MLCRPWEICDFLIWQKLSEDDVSGKTVLYFVFFFFFSYWTFNEEVKKVVRAPMLAKWLCSQYAIQIKSLSGWERKSCWALKRITDTTYNMYPTVQHAWHGTQVARHLWAQPWGPKSVCAFPSHLPWLVDHTFPVKSLVKVRPQPLATLTRPSHWAPAVWSWSPPCLTRNLTSPCDRVRWASWRSENSKIPEVFASSAFSLILDFIEHLFK